MKIWVTLTCAALALVITQPHASLADKIKKTRYDGPPPFFIDTRDIPNAVPKQETQSLYGNDPFYVTNGACYFPLVSSEGYKERGTASWYGTQFHSLNTSSGEPYNMLALTAAHKTLPIPTYVRVTNLKNHRSIVVRINDRGPFCNDRLIDLSWAAAKKLGIHGTAPVEVVALSPHARPNPDAKKFIYTLQVAAFKTAARTEKVKQQLTKKFPKEDISIHKSKNFYRIRMGPYNDINKVRQLKTRLKRLGYSDPVLLKS